MKYAILGPRGGINRISETEPQFVQEGHTVVEITDEQAATVQAGRNATPKVVYFWISGRLGSYAERQAADALAGMSLEEIKELKLLELAESAKQEAQSKLTTSDGLVFHTDASTMIHVQGIKGWFTATGNNVYPNYKNADGTVNNLTEEMVDNAISEYTGRLYDIYSVRYAARKQEVEAATTKQEINAITWS